MRKVENTDQAREQEVMLQVKGSGEGVRSQAEYKIGTPRPIVEDPGGGGRLVVYPFLRTLNSFSSRYPSSR
jgi:hypothetical protein